jgi:hypothetical protein
MWHNLESSLKFQLCLSITLNLARIAGVVLTKVVHLDEVLDEVQRVGIVWLTKLLK